MVKVGKAEETLNIFREHQAEGGQGREETPLRTGGRPPDLHVVEDRGVGYL